MLLLKQKIKIFTIFKKPFAIAAAVAVFSMILGSFFVQPDISLAQQNAVANFDPSGIGISLDIVVDGKKDNFIRIAKDQTSATSFQAVVRITSLNSKNLGSRQVLQLGTDTLDFNTASGILAQRPLKTFGTGIEIVGSGNTCKSNAISGIIPFSESSAFTSCAFPGGQGNATLASGQLELNKEYTFTFNLNPSQINSLGLNRPCERGVQTTACFSVAPFFGLDIAFGIDKNITAYKIGKDIFVKVYDKKSDLDAEAASGVRPTDVPGYGGTQGGVNTSREGSAILGLINQIINVIVGMAQQFIYWVFYLLVAPLIQAMLSIQTYTDTFAAVIYPGWEVVRNACNILFIVALIAIGLGTLFRVESYQYKHLLVDLIIAALLVNFSLVIAQVILGVADTVQSQFLPNNLEVIRSLAKDLMAGFKTVDFSHIADAGYFSTTLQPLFSLGLSIGSFIVFASIAGFLLVRIIMLWVLLMLSPLAYAMRVLPQTKSYTGMWWSQFIKYAFFTPVMAFFLNMAAVINNNYNSQLNNKTGIFQQIIDDPSILGNSDIAAFVFRVGGNIIILVFLFVAIKVAEGAGVYGADAVAKAAKGGIFAPFAGVGWLGEKGRGYIGRKWNEKTSHMVEGRKVGLGKRIAFAALNPVAVAKGWKKRSEELKHAAEGEAEAVGLMVVEQTMSKGKAFNRKAIAERAHDADFLKNYGDLTREEAIDTAYDVTTMANNMDGRAARRAIIEANMQEGWIDDIIQEAQENGRGKELIAQMKNLKSKQYRIRDADFEISDVKDKDGNVVYEKNDDGSIKLDETGKGVSKKKRNLKYNEKTRRALYLAMFGEHISKHVDKDGNEHEHVALADQTAAKMLADGGEKHGRSTRHAEYMAAQVYDSAANNKEGGYGFYNLQYASKVKDDDGTEHDVVNGYAVSGQYKGQLITTANAGADHARREVAKMGAREQAGIAHHAVMDISNGKLDKDMFRVVSKALLDSPGFAQERSANYLIAGTDDIEEINRITKKYFETGKLDVDEAAMQRVKDMFEVNPAAAEIVLRKFLNKTSGDGPKEVRDRKLMVNKYDATEGKFIEVNLLPVTPVAPPPEKKK